MIRKYISDSTHILEDLIIPLQSNVMYEEVPVHILSHKGHRMQKKIYPFREGWVIASLRSESNLKA